MIWFILAIAAVWIACIVGLAGTVIYAILTGRLPNKLSPVFRDESPRRFWFLVSARIVLVLGMLYCTFYVAHAPGIGLI